MSHHTTRALAEGVRESIAATTPHSRHRTPHPRFTWSAVLGWAVVAALCFISLALSSVLPR